MASFLKNQSCIILLFKLVNNGFSQGHDKSNHIFTA